MPAYPYSNGLPWALWIALVLAGSAVLFLGATIIVALAGNNLDPSSALVLLALFSGIVAAVVVPILHGCRTARRLAIGAHARPEGVSYEVVLRGRSTFGFRLPRPRSSDGYLLLEDKSLVLALRGHPERRVLYSDVRSIEAAQLWWGGSFHGIALATVNNALSFFLFEKGQPATTEFRDAVVAQIRRRVDRNATASSER